MPRILYIIGLTGFLLAFGQAWAQSHGNLREVRTSRQDSLQTSTGLYPLEEILKFGDYLFVQGEYERALIEFLRYRFLSDADSSHVQLRLGRCRLLMNEPYLALSEFKEGMKPGTPELKDSLAFGMEASLLRVKAREEGIKPPAAGPSLGAEPLPLRRQALYALGLMMDGEWSKAQEGLTASGEHAGSGRSGREVSGSWSSSWTDLLELAKAGDERTGKSPALAALLSSVVPGAGKIYSGRLGDGIFSLLLFSFTAWEAYTGFDEDGASSVKGWTFAALSSFFYMGNIYGSYAAAKIHNDRVDQGLTARLALGLRYWTSF